MRKVVRIVALVVVAVLVAGLAVAGFTYRRQLVSLAIHRKGSPTHTEAYQPLSPAPSTRLAVAGDVGDSGSRLDATAAAMDALEADGQYDALLLLGDNVYPSGDPARLKATVLDPFAGVLDGGTELLAILGNHDVKDGNGPAQMKALGMPGRYWSREVGDVLVVGLDSNRPADPAQLAFAQRVLSGSDARWKVVMLHHPPYSAGYQGSSEDVRRIWQPVFERNGVQLVLSGHEHDYQRSKVINGVTYVVSGAASGTRRTGEEDFTAESFSWHHFVDIGVYDDRMVLRAVNQDGRVADEVVINP